MKKIGIFIIFLLGTMLFLRAQFVDIYNFESRTGTWMPLTEGNLIHDGSVEAAPLKEAFAALTFNNSTIGSKNAVKDIGFPIGFDFRYGRDTMNRFALNSNGSIILGKDIVHSTGTNIKNGFENSKTEAFYLNLIGVMPSNKEAFGLNTTQIRYSTTGVSPHRILTVQFTDLGYDLGYTSDKPRKIDSVNFQIKLYEGSNKIEFVFGTYLNHYMSTPLNCGLKGNIASDLHLRGSNFANSTQVTNINAMQWSATNYPTSGLTYTFTPPPPCTTPEYAPKEFSLQANSVEVKGVFASAADAQYYLVVQTTQAAHSEMPVNGTLYKRGDYIGNGKVIRWFKDTVFQEMDLNPSTMYYYHIYPANDNCSGGPLYANDKRISKVVKTLPPAPKLMAILSTSFDSIVLCATANTDQPEMLILMTDKPFKTLSETFMRGNFGTIGFQLKEGDYTDSGALVVYKGGSFDRKAFTNLKNNTIYHFAAFSLDERDSTCSSVFAQVDTITYGTIPYVAAFDFMPLSISPYAWETSGNKKPTIAPGLGGDPNYGLWNTNGNNGLAVNTLTSPWIRMGSEREARLLFTYNITSVGKQGSIPYNNWGSDSLEFQYSENGKDYITFFTIDNGNKDSIYDRNMFANKRISMSDLKGKVIKLRLRWKITTAPQLKFYPIKIEEVYPCDYPVNVSVIDSTIFSDQAKVKWETVNEETSWFIRYRKVGAENWSEPMLANVNPYLLTGLPSHSLVQVQVQAQCSQTEMSVWSQTSEKFQSGYVVPFLENHNNEPLYWERKKGNFTDTVKNLAIATSDTWLVFPWKYGNNTNKALLKELTNKPSNPLHAWLLSPVVNLGDGKLHYQLELDVALTKGTGAANAVKPDTISKTAVFSIVISTDGGKTFLKKNTLKTFDSTNNSFLNIGDSTHIVIDLSSYTGNVQIGFYLHTTGGEKSVFWIDNIGILPTCPNPSDLTMQNIEAGKASLVFNSSNTFAEWLVGIKDVRDDADCSYRSIDKKQCDFTDLIARTDYHICLRCVCAVGDTSSLVSIKFTMPSLEECALPQDVQVKNISKTNATLTWMGEAQRYALRYKAKTAVHWTIIDTITMNEYRFASLESGSMYQYSLQSICSEAEGDTSVWTVVDTFATIGVTCFMPQNLRAGQLTHTSALLSWKGLAKSFQIAYRMGTEGDWKLLTANEETCLLTELSPRTLYTAKVRGVCAEGDSSVWTEVLTFTTAIIPVCDAPFDLKSSDISETSAKLSWGAASSNGSWSLYYRASTVTVWDTVKNVSEKMYVLENLLANTAYLWSVQGYCEEGRSSVWAKQVSFSTLQIANEDEKEMAFLRVVADKGRIHILNEKGMYIERIEIYNALGQMQQRYMIKSSENVIINTNLPQSIFVLRVYGGEGEVKSFKLFGK